MEYSLLSSWLKNKILFSIRTQSEAASFAQSRILWIITSSTLLKNMRSSWFIELNCRMWTRCCCRNVNNKPIIFPLDYFFCPILSEFGVHRIILLCSVGVNLKVPKILTLREEVLYVFKNTCENAAHPINYSAYARKNEDRGVWTHHLDLSLSTWVDNLVLHSSGYPRAELLTTGHYCLQQKTESLIR